MSGLNDFFFGSNDAQKEAEKAAKGAQFSPFNYVGPGGSLSGFSTLTPGPGSQPVGADQLTLDSNGLFATQYKSDGGRPLLVDPRTGQGFVMMNGKKKPIGGSTFYGPNGTKITAANGVIQNYQSLLPQQPMSNQPVPNAGAGVGAAVMPGQQPVPGSPGAPTGSFANVPAPGNANPLAQGGVTQGAVPGTAMGFENKPGQTGVGGLGALDPTYQALVNAFGPLTQAGIQQSGGTNPNAPVLPSAYNAFGDLYQNNLAALRNQAQPREEEQFNALQERLFSQGRLGTTGGSMNIQAFARGLGEADVARQLSAFQTAQGVAGQQEGVRQFDTQTLMGNIERAIGQGQMTFQQAQQLFGNIVGLNQVGSQNFTNALNASIARSNAASGSASALAQMPQDNGQLAGFLNSVANVYGTVTGKKA